MYSMFQQISNLFLKRKIYFDDFVVFLLGFFYGKLKIMNEYNEFLFSLKKEMRPLNFVPRCTWAPLGMGLNFVSTPKLFSFCSCC